MFWPSKKIELFYETSKEKINFLNLNEANSNLMYVFENDKVKSLLLKEISKSKYQIYLNYFSYNHLILKRRDNQIKG